MIKIAGHTNSLHLIYQPDRFNDARWLDDKLKQDGSVTLRRTFTFTSADFIPQATEPDADNDGERIFALGVSVGGYYKISKEILGLKYDLLVDRAMKLESRTFIAQRDISVFRRIDELVDEPIIVGGDDASAIPLADFEQLLKTFPTTTELTHYARSRISRVLMDYFGTLSDAEDRLNRYLSSKKTLVTDSRESLLANFELQKFEYIHNELKSMLAAVDSYTEKDWQAKILGLLLFVFPKYIAVLENVHIKDFYSKPGKESDRYIDLMLVDANGNIDITEVKKPFSNALLSRHKYRDNHTPRNELAGTVMQAEKYLFHLSKWGCAGEQEIYRKRKSELPAGIELKITNPKALILLGRDNDFTGEQRFDFEIIRRKYANMLDIMTYDDLLRRLDNIIVMMKRQVSIGSVK
ncbi:Shedu immune nuclease family protein [Chromobacterium subtsugae]|uniref:Shedu immune nuclease family protein n=1 Tax=Chromobacterium subtsugae TaxID=251747 RepID=UPI00064155C0|nr:Shedu immune nuclease family protein [Chromobacterium subtsugae]